MSLPFLPRTLKGLLTLRLGIAITIILVLLSVITYAALARSLHSDNKAYLALQTSRLEDVLRRRPGVLRRAAISVNPIPLARQDVYIQILAPNGKMLARSVNLQGEMLPVRRPVLDAALQHKATYREFNFNGGQVGMYTAPLERGRKVRAVVSVARDLDRINRFLAVLRLVAGVGLLTTLILSVALIRLTAGRSLRPLERLVTGVERIGSLNDLGRRVPVQDSHDEVGALAVAFNRMLERLDASNTELRAAHEQVRQALDAQRRFAADASHELRTPLTTIRGNAGFLQQFPNVSPEDRAAALAQIGEEADHMSRLIHDLLALARMDSGIPLELTELDLATVAEEALRQVIERYPNRDIRAPQVESVHIQGDAGALRRLVFILLDNAVKYTPVGSWVSLRLTTADSDAVLAVEDTGIGIEAADLPHIFERFYRVDRGRVPEGVGLGLSIAHGIAARHGGKIEAHSELGRGSVFTLRLPLV